MIKELCEVGQDLWECRSICNEDSYNNYVNHIKSCSECMQRLGLTKEDIEILNEDELDELEPIDIGKFETVTDTELVEEIKRRGIKIEIPGNDNNSNFCSSERPRCYDCGTICTHINRIKIGDVIFDIEEYETR